MQVILTSNFSDEAYAESALKTGLSQEAAEAFAKDFNSVVSEHSPSYAVVKPDDYRLWRGMEDLV